MKIFIVILNVFMLSCANASSELKVHGIQVDKNKLQLLVTSTGCTSKDSFQLNWQENAVLVEQVTPDNCRRLPHRIWVKFDLPENKQLFTLMNAISK
jgi:hypothetical protein